MFIIIPMTVLLLLEFIIEPVFKIRMKVLNRLGGLLTGISIFVITFSAFLILTSQFPSVDARIFTFTCSGIMIYFIPKNFEKYMTK